MKITAIKTKKIIPGKSNLVDVLCNYLKKFKGREKIIIAITSKVISICEGKVVKIGSLNKIDLITQEADFILPLKKNKNDIILTLKNNILIPTAGIDESNGNGNYILWPKNPQKSANDIRKYLCKFLGVKYIGVIITDSKTTPLRRGTTGIAVAHSGFVALNDYIGQKDLFGRKLKVTKSNVADALAVAAVLVMGEGAEQTPLAIIEEIPGVKFQKTNPTAAELKDLKISLKSDLYAPLLKGAKWKKCSRTNFD
jgi:dihydrofolate synthase / folylpolyglutamate synthase